MTVGIGDPGVPQENGGVVRRWNTLWLYAEDAWRVHDRVTLTYGLGWGFDGVLNHDLQQAGPAGATPRQRRSGTDATRMEQLLTRRRCDLDAVIGPEDRPSRRRGPFLPAARTDVGHGRRTGCARPARPWPADSCRGAPFSTHCRESRVSPSARRWTFAAHPHSSPAQM